MDNINKPNNDILDQIASYSQAETDNFYYSIKNELDAQKKLNKVLKEDKYEENIISINNFISRNSNTIDYQFEELSKITKELKNLVNENMELKNKYNEIINSEDCKDISNKLKEIKKIKQDITLFLDKAGI